MDDAGAGLTASSERILTLVAKKSSPTMSAHIPAKFLPETFPNLDDPSFTTPPPAQPVSSPPSEAPPSVFEEQRDMNHELSTEPTQPSSRQDSPPDEHGAYDLKPPPPSVSHSNAEFLADRLISVDHLNVVLRDHSFFQKFTNFLNRYRPHANPTLVQYLETQKAIAAINYANAIAEQILGVGSQVSSGLAAAIVDERFESRALGALEELVNDALPAYVTHQLTHIVTECLVKEITGNNAPIMRELVQGLAEVYCLTDPSQPDNPIVYASEEFFKTTQYGREYVIGRNCRFLQGPKSSPSSISRLAEALQQGHEVCELILNYRRDGSPFLNLLMIAPLYDNRGSIRYFIGCQVDVTNLAEGGRGLESFRKLLATDRNASRLGSSHVKSSLKALGEFGELLSNEEMDVIRERGRSEVESGRNTPAISSTPIRRFVGMDDPSEENFWPDPYLGHSGRLPGVYQNYLLVRPYPSLRITFTSPALRIPGLVQSRFLDRVGGPQHVREGLQEALTEGVGVTAKISWLTNANSNDQSSIEGKPRWIHCTPLLGSDEKVGVWMIVMVEKEDITGSLNVHTRRLSETRPQTSISRMSGGKLYADYLRREGRLSQTPSRVSVPGSRRSNSMRVGGRSAELVRPIEETFDEF